MSAFATMNPATGRDLERFETYDRAHLERVLVRSHDAFRAWRTTTFTERATLMHAAAEQLRGRKAELAAISTREMGKPIAEAEAEIEKCAVSCDYFADHAHEFLSDETAPSNATESYVGFRPLGTVLAVMPWNFPFWQVFRFAGPGLMAGNVAILKHASNVTRCALEIEDIFGAAGFPNGVFQTVIVPGDEVKDLIADGRIAAVTLTGSEAAGISVASAAGRHLKKCVLELGGSDAFIVLADADLDAAAQIAAKARFQNTGQSCIAAKRFIIEAPVYDAFVERFVAATRALKVGDPTERDTRVGPMARGDLRDELLRTHGDRRRRAGDADVRRGDVRPGRRRRAGPRHGARDRTRQRFEIRARRQSLDDRHRAREDDRGTARERQRVHQRHDRERSAFAVRRRETERLRARTLALRHPRIRQHPNRVDRTRYERVRVAA
jgi:succinate-semialdehyde dehydrogenase/glutarate-semialdehyde dehydrogenase